jgi:hypothetical protein
MAVDAVGYLREENLLRHIKVYNSVVRYTPNPFPICVFLVDFHENGEVYVSCSTGVYDTEVQETRALVPSMLCSFRLRRPMSFVRSHYCRSKVKLTRVL